MGRPVQAKKIILDILDIPHLKDLSTFFNVVMMAPRRGVGVAPAPVAHAAVILLEGIHCDKEGVHSVWSTYNCYIESR